MQKTHKKRVLFLRILRPLSPGGFSIPSRRLTTAAVSLLFVLLVLPLFSFTRVYNAHDTHTHTYGSLSAPAQASASLRAGAGIGTALRTLLTPATATAATADTLNFQARLQSAGGAIVPDGYYDIQFKLYSVSTGGSALWTETYAYNSGSGSCSGPVGTNDCRVRVVNGYVSVYLGSQTSFPTTIPWDQQLYLTMNVGGTTNSGTITYDGEMTPRLKLTAVPYAMRANSANQLSTSNGGNQTLLNFAGTPTGNVTYNLNAAATPGTYDVCTSANNCSVVAGSGNYIQNQNTAAQTAANFWIDGTGTATTLSATNGTFGNVSIQGNAASAFVLKNSSGANNSNTILNVDTTATGNNLVTNGSFELDTTGWSANGTNASIARQAESTAPFGGAALQVTTTATPSSLAGAKFSVTLNSATIYAFSAYVKAISATQSTFSLGYSLNNSTNTTCTTTGSTNTSGWVRVGCTFTTGTVTANPTYVFVGSNDTTARSYYIDGVSLVATGNTSSGAWYQDANIVLNGVVTSPFTLQNTVNNTAAFVVANALGNALISVDTVNSSVNIGGTLNANAAANFNNTVLVSNSSTTAFRVRNNSSLISSLSANTTTVNLLSNGGAENGTTGWATNGTGVTAPAVNTTYYRSGAQSMTVITSASATANAGMKYPYTMTNGTTYTLNFYARTASGSFSTLVAGRADDGATNTTCLTGQTVTTYWQHYTCTFTAGAQSGTPYVFVGQSDAGVAHTYYVDDIQLTTAANAAYSTGSRAGTVQINGSVNAPVLLQNYNDSTEAFQVQNAAGGIVMNVNTVTGQIDFSGAVTMTGLMTANGGVTIATGQSFVNGGSTLNTALAVADLPSGGSVGSAESYTTFNVNQTTTGQTLTLATPGVATAGRIAYVNNVGTASFTMYGVTISSAKSQSYMWNGTSWVTLGVDTVGGGVTSVGAYTN